MAKHVAVWLWIAGLTLGQTLLAQSPGAQTGVQSDSLARPRYGAISGSVTDTHGAAQAGVPVTILREDGRVVGKVLTGDTGRYQMPGLPAGMYSAQVLEPSFVPFLKSSILVKAGAIILVDINLLSLAESMRVNYPVDLDRATEEWKWILRATSPTRPILRFNDAQATSVAMRDPRERALRGTVQLAAGNDSGGFGQNPGLRTAFDMAYAMSGAQRLGFAGSGGWERGTPAASLRATWDRVTPMDGRSSLSIAMRQLFLPGEYWANTAVADGTQNHVSSVTLAYEQEKALSQELTIQYGSLFDTLNLGRKMSRWSPFARVSYVPAKGTLFALYFAAANPHVLPADWNPDHPNEEQWLAIPQVSAREDGRPVLEGGQHVEASWDEQVGDRIHVQSAAFYDASTNTALSIAFPGANELTDALLRDPFSDRYFLSGGRTGAIGGRFAAAAKLSRNSEVIVGYSYAPGLRSESDNLEAEDVAVLRELIHGFREHSVSLKVDSRVAWSGTRVVASYRWLPSNVVSMPDPYDRGIAKADPYLNLLVQQPLPSPEILPGNFEAVADFSNLLAQGYVSIHPASGAHGYLFPFARSFRGGFNYTF